MNEHILSDEVQEYLRRNLGQSPAEIALAKSPFEHVSSSALAEQLDGLQRSQRKLPLWYRTPGIYYPSKLSVEQSSSEATAQFKQQLIGEEERVVDLTGGFGVDAYFLSQRAKHVTYVERAGELASIVSHNMQRLGARNVTCLSEDGITHLLRAPIDNFDCAYIDPSRRVGGKKVFLLRDCEPDVEDLHLTLLAHVPVVLVKAAPLLDITSTIQQLSHITDIYLLSINNECKELIIVLRRGYVGAPTISAILLTPHGQATHSFRFRPSEERDASAPLGAPAGYLYEPDAAVMKAGAYKLVAVRYGLHKLHTNTHLYSSKTRIKDFPGRTFRIEKVIPYAQFKKDKGVYAGNVATRNFPLRVDDLRRKHRIGESPNAFLFFCTDPSGQLIVIFASK